MEGEGLTFLIKWGTPSLPLLAVGSWNMKYGVWNSLKVLKKLASDMLPVFSTLFYSDFSLSIYIYILYTLHIIAQSYQYYWKKITNVFLVMYIHIYGKSF